MDVCKNPELSLPANPLRNHMNFSHNKFMLAAANLIGAWGENASLEET